MKKLLLIEDDQIFANIYRNKLVLDGFQVEIAYDGDTGFKLLHSFRPDAVILDLILPKMSGVEIIRKLRAEPEFAQLPVIVFTNTYLTSIVQEAWKAGATKCLAKANCNPGQVISALRQIFSGKGGKGGKSGKGSAAEATAPIEEMPADAETEFQTELRRSFVDNWPSTLAAIRGHLQSLTKAEDESARQLHLHELYRRVHQITGSAGITGMYPIAQLTDAFEALLRELHDNPDHVTVSTLRTVASAVDFLAALFQNGAMPGKRPPVAKVLVVEDEDIARRAILHALEKARLKSVMVEDPVKALELVLDNKFDLVFLDVGLPNMNGFELCAKLRTLPAYKKTPVVFITSQNDFESRANSSISGGSDFIAKPFIYVELAVKALIYALRNREQTTKA